MEFILQFSGAWLISQAGRTASFVLHGECGHSESDSVLGIGQVLPPESLNMENRICQGLVAAQGESPTLLLDPNLLRAEATGDVRQNQLKSLQYTTASGQTCFQLFLLSKAQVD